MEISYKKLLCLFFLTLNASIEKKVFQRKNEKLLKIFNFRLSIFEKPPGFFEVNDMDNTISCVKKVYR